jgi:hypothetical protein
MANYASLADLETLVHVYETAQTSTKQSIANVENIYQNQKMTFLSQDITAFLNSHILFWNQLNDMLNGIKVGSTELKAKIEQSE